MIKKANEETVSTARTGFLTLGKVKRADAVDNAAFMDLASHLRFSPKNGRIWLDNRRMLLVDSYAMGALRMELIESLGVDAARGLLTRMGYTCGTRDALLALKLRASEEDFRTAFLAGSWLHALEGMVQTETVTLEFDSDRGHFYADFIWRDSSEGEIHVNNYGVGSEPGCWMQVGYTSGYASVFLGRPILFREVQCTAMGHEHCRVVGQPPDEWEGVEKELSFLRPQPFVSRNLQDMQPMSTPAPASQGEAPAIKGATRDLGSSFSDQSALEQVSSYGEFVGISARFNAACHMLTKVAPTDATVLFLGESGVGKELFARSLHKISSRSHYPFVAVNCAAIPENLVESELFGVEKGAFTGAVVSRAGRFELADKGTLFLDEIGTLSLFAQGKLLRVLQEREIERVGSTTTKRIDVRVIAAANVDMREEIRAGRFREDLYFRLNVFPIRIPPLRERRDDIPLLMEALVHRYTVRHRRNLTGFTSRAVDALLSYSWPGNIRELENVVERGVILAVDNGPIDVCHLFTNDENIRTSGFKLSEAGVLKADDEGAEALSEASAAPNAPDLGELFLRSRHSLDEWEEILVGKAMSEAGGNVSKAAKTLGITRARLEYRVKKLGGAAKNARTDN
jgi:DNA-binding NtrC family response regulator/predicted hydrocarbon binding protein